MNNYLILSSIGLVAGIIDVLPMIKQKLDKYSISSAFTYHLIMPFIIFHLDIDMSSWLKGGVFYLVCSIPVLLLVAKGDKKSVSIIAIVSTVIGILVGTAISFLIN